VEAKAASFAVGVVVAQGHGNGAESDFPPGNFVFGEQRDFQRFAAGREVEGEQAGPVDGMYLTDVGHANEGVHRADLDLRAGFLGRLPCGSLGQRLMVFHETGGQGPHTVARLDGAAAEQHLVFPFRQAADHQLGVLVMDGAASVADRAGQNIARRHAPADGSAAVTAIVDGGVHGGVIRGLRVF